MDSVYAERQKRNKLIEEFSPYKLKYETFRNVQLLLDIYSIMAAHGTVQTCLSSEEEHYMKLQMNQFDPDYFTMKILPFLPDQIWQESHIEKVAKALKLSIEDLTHLSAEMYNHCLEMTKEGDGSLYFNAPDGECVGVFPDNYTERRQVPLTRDIH